MNDKHEQKNQNTKTAIKIIKQAPPSTIHVHKYVLNIKGIN